mgnify:CR=1 FL=1|jgi:glycosyltransferase involved in cell wall biosynthesis
MNILFLCPSLQIRSEWMFRLINNLREEIACIATNEPNPKRLIIKQESLNPFHAKLFRKINEDINLRFTYSIILKGIEKSHKTSVNYIHFLSFAKKFKHFILNSSKPTLIHCHGKDIMWDLKDFTTGRTIHKSKYFEFLNLIKDRVYFIANSDFTKNQLLKKGVQGDRIFINHFGIELKPEKNFTDSKTIKILYLGRLVDFKGPLETIKAFNLACKAGMNAELIIAGRGELEEKCKELVASSPYKAKIFLKGWVDKDEAEELYRTCDLFTAHNKVDEYTNQVEAFGVTIIEAMSYSLPVITGKCGGVEDSIRDGETGYLIDPGNIEEHAEKFLKLYEDVGLRKKMGKNARQRIKDHFSLKKEKQGLKKILDKITEE